MRAVLIALLVVLAGCGQRIDRLVDALWDMSRKPWCLQRSRSLSGLRPDVRHE